MLIFNTYNTLNLKKLFTALIRPMFVDIIMLSIITNVQKILLHTGGNKTKMAKFALSSSLKQLPWQPDIQ